MRAKKKKARASRQRMTHFEVRRGGALRLRLAIADDAFVGAGDELGALLKKIAPGAVSTSTVVPSAITVLTPDAPSEPSDFVVSPQHADDDDHYHAALRERLSELFGSLCDSSLTDALEIAGAERARRSEVN